MSRVISDTTPTARKEHRCDLCDRTIRVGEVYHRQRGVSDTPYVWKCCAHCDAVLSALDFSHLYAEEGICPDDLRDYEPTTWTEARWLVQWRRKWTRRDGTLHPVPGGGDVMADVTPDHDFWGVAGHPDDDECTHRTDGTYCGRPAAMHESGGWA